jgi:hypothetical protein
MARLLYILVMAVISMAGSEVLADPPSARAAAHQCPVDVRLKRAEKDALRLFNGRLEALFPLYGRDTMASRLATIIENEYPDKKVIEVSPAFYEHVLHYIDFSYVFNDIELTIGKNHPLWSRTGDFRRYRDKVMSVHHSGLRGWERENFDAAAEAIVAAIDSAPLSQMRIRSRNRELTQEEANIIKVRAISGITSTYMLVGQWDEIYKAIAAENARWTRNLALEIGLFALTGFALPGGLFVWTTIKAGALMAKTARYAVSATSASGISAVRAVTMSDVLMGGGLGALGAPAGMRLLDASGAVFDAVRLSRNTDTIFLCQLGKQMNRLSERGVAPYFKAALVGSAFGLGGTGISAISPAFARGVLFLTRLGVWTALGSTGVSVITSRRLMHQEFGFAEEAMASDNRDLAIRHIRRAREHAVTAGDSFMNGLLLALLVVQVQGNYGQVMAKFKNAMQMAAAAIETRALYASSADTMPVAAENAWELLQDAGGATMYLVDEVRTYMASAN